MEKEVAVNKGWRNGQEELEAEVEGFIKGEVQAFTRYRNRNTELLLNVLETLNIPTRMPVTVPPQAHADPVPVHAAATTNTVHEI